MAVVLSISAASESALPALEILGHTVHTIGFDPSQIANAPRHDLTILDCRVDLAGAKAIARFKFMIKRIQNQRARIATRARVRSSSWPRETHTVQLDAF